MSDHATPPDPAIPELVDQFHRDGYLILRNVLSPEKVARLNAAVDAVVAEEPESLSHNIYHWMRPGDYARHSEELLKGASPYRRQLLGVLETDDVKRYYSNGPGKVPELPLKELVIAS